LLPGDGKNLVLFYQFHFFPFFFKFKTASFSCPSTSAYVLHSIAISFYIGCACLAGGVRTKSSW